MFNGKRRFDGRQGEQILNKEMFTLYEILKHFLDTPENPSPKVGPQSDLEKAGALWLDRQSYPGNGHLMYRDSDRTWKSLYDDWFKITRDIRNPEGQPENPREGQLWINDSGVLHWFNGSMFVPIKSELADASEFDANSFENFLIIDPLKMTGGYMIENLSKLAKLAGGINQWKANTLYQIGDIVYYTDAQNETIFYKYTDAHVKWDGQGHTSNLTFSDEINSGYLEQVDLKAQYLIPSETLDKIFIDSLYTDKESYDIISDVCIQISLSLYRGKTVAAVHVNPIALKNIRKRIVKIEKDPKAFGNYGMIKVGPDNTEYYGFKDGFGQLLLKNQDYVTKVDGIQLIGEAIEIYDFVYAVTYEFEVRIKTQGVLNRGSVNLNNQTSIWIGQIDPADKLLIFVQGLCLEDFYWSYDCYDPSGLVKFNGYDVNGNVTSDPNKMVKPLFESKTDVTIMRFRKKTNIGVFTQDMLSNTSVDSKELQSDGTYTDPDGKIHFRAEIDIPTDYKQPLVFVQGPYLNLTLGDYTIQDGKAIIDNAIAGSAYYIVDAIRQDGFNAYIKAGTVGANQEINYVDQELLSGECKPLIFVNGFYISSNDYDLSDPGVIKIHGLTEGQGYTLLRDKQDDMYQLLFDGEVSFSTIPVKSNIDDAMVYIGSSVIIDGGACFTSSYSTDNAINNEIRYILSNGVESWYTYNAALKKWEKIYDEKYSSMLDLASSGYSVDKRSINILQNFGEVRCNYYGYRFADNIEKPLIKGYTNNYEIIGDNVFYMIDYRHSYSMGDNAITVWMNGIRQDIVEHYEIKTLNEKKRTVQGFLLPIPTDSQGNVLSVFPTCYYVIEEPETGEFKSCAIETLGEPVGINTYLTNNIILSPGVPRVFLDGYRQPSTSYMINDMNTITLIEAVVTNEKDTVMVQNEDSQNAFVKVDSRTNVTVEVRQDFRLKEKTVQLTKENIDSMIQGATAILDANMIYKDDQKLPYDLFISKTSEVNIYLNGANYGKDFSKIRNQDTIILTNIEIVKLLKEGDFITVEWR